MPAADQRPGLLVALSGSFAQIVGHMAIHHHRGRLGYAITPRFAPTSTPALLEAVQRLRAEFPDTRRRGGSKARGDGISQPAALMPAADQRPGLLVALSGRVSRYLAADASQ
jgi:hypothetical protein